MKKSRFSEEQIIGFLRQAEAGMPIKELCRNGGFSNATFYKWRAKFGGMQVSEAQHLRGQQSLRRQQDFVCFRWAVLASKIPDEEATRASGCRQKRVEGREQVVLHQKLQKPGGIARYRNRHIAAEQAQVRRRPIGR